MLFRSNDALVFFFNLFILFYLKETNMAKIHVNDPRSWKKNDFSVS